MARGWQITVALVDGQDTLTSKTLTLDAAITDPADAQTALDSYLADFGVASDLGVVSASLTIPLTVTPTTAENTSNFDEGVNMSILTTDGKKWSDRIPGPAKTAGVFDYVTGRKVDTADAAITGLYANYLAAGAFRFGDVAQQTMAAAGGIVSGTLEKA